jgi:hypothetical protein
MNELLLISATLMSGLLASVRGEHITETDYVRVRRIAVDQAKKLIEETGSYRPKGDN